MEEEVEEIGHPSFVFPQKNITNNLSNTKQVNPTGVNYRSVCFQTVIGRCFDEFGKSQTNISSSVVSH
ncbi:hypothetical protein GAB14E_4280 [Colwellia psychrerythraea]|uniref:Uncharacterized protein n=1 Tax=Colwellia psychrerythraea TaxID=28229 RepID=A0A099KD28_COLPS|nr:hypothetical protein GAB14E_4280 [Colwellia psychrerythraea]